MATAPLTTLDSVEKVIDTLGGVPGVRDLTGAGSYQQVDNWRKRGRFASRTFVVLTEALRERGFAAPEALWGMVPTQAPEDAH